MSDLTSFLHDRLYRKWERIRAEEVEKMPRNLGSISPNSVWDFMSEVERAFDDLWRAPQGSSPAQPPSESGFTPAVDVHETADFYLLSFDLPGVPQKDVTIHTANNRLTVSGERHSQKQSEDKLFKRLERSTGRFQRSFQLPPDIDETKIQARYENGVLEILIPKSEVAKPRSIHIDTEKGGLFSRLLGQKNVESNSKSTEGLDDRSTPFEKH